MNEYTLIYPMFAMVVLAFAVVLALFRARVRSISNGEISPFYYKIYQGENEPELSLKLSQHFSNIFESPTLFYIACLVAMVIGEVVLAFHVLAWVYVATRVVHAYIHIGNNKLKRRVAAYFSSWVVLISMWVYLVIHVTM